MSRGMNASVQPPYGDVDGANAWMGPANANDEKLCAKFFSIHGCAYGADCHFLHTYRPGLPVPPRPAPLPYVYTMSDAMRPQVNEKIKTRLCREFLSRRKAVVSATAACLRTGKRNYERKRQTRRLWDQPTCFKRRSSRPCSCLCRRSTSAP